jgi:glycerophosphoryl diester phosphodiesterase
MQLLNKRLFKELHSRGSLIALFGPGIDSKEDQRKFIEMGADLLVTDRPDNLRAVLDEMHATDKLSRL